MSTPHGEHGHKSENPLVQVMVSMSGAAAPEHETEPPGANADSFKAGHEPDRFAVKGILYVPVLVAVVLVVTYVFVTVAFKAIVTPPGVEVPLAANANPQVAELNQPLINERFGRTSSTDPRPILDRPGTAVPQPRLEFLREQAGGGPSDPPFLRSKRAMQERNPPEVRPEDLRPMNYIDPGTGEKVLAIWAYVDDKKELIRVPIDTAIDMVEHGKIRLPVRKDPVDLKRTTESAAKASNGGHILPAAAANPPAEAKDDHNHGH